MLHCPSLLLKLLLNHFFSTSWWEQDSWRTDRVSRALLVSRLVSSVHRLSGSAVRNAGTWPCTQLCWSPQWLLVQPLFCPVHRDISPYDEAAIFTRTPSYGQVLLLALAYVQQCHRLIKCFGLARTFKDHLAQSTCSEQDRYLQLDQFVVPGKV